MAAVLALLSSALYGTADYLGGTGSRRAPILHVLVVTQTSGLLVLLGVAWFFDASVSRSDLGYGVIGGSAGLAGLFLLYRGLAWGPIVVVAPVTAVLSAALPVAFDLARGIAPSRWQGLGILAGLGAIVIMSLESRDPTAPPVTWQIIVSSAAAGAGFGTFFVLLDLVDGGSAPWPVIASRASSALLLISIVSVRRERLAKQAMRAPIVLAGIGDSMANLLFLLALRHGSLATVAVLGSLYPGVTVLLAAVVLRERPDHRQMVGLVIALVAVAFIAGG